MSSILRLILSSLILPAALCGCAGMSEQSAPNMEAGPVNQLRIAGNACGPAALLASMKCGNEDWQEVYKEIPGGNDRSKLLYLIRAHGLKPSSSLNGRKRWSKSGINSTDLTEIAGEMAAIGGLPTPKQESLLTSVGENPHKHLKRLHKRLHASLRNGFPPMVTLRRHVHRNGLWQTIQGHFASIIHIDAMPSGGSSSFGFICYDPWGGKKMNGRFTIPETTGLPDMDQFFSTAVAELPEANIGRSNVRSGEKTVIITSVVIGTW